MGSIRYRIRSKGIDRLIDRLDPAKLEAKVEGTLAVGVQKMAIQAYKNAPVETGALRASILRSVQRDGDLEYIFGSYMPYAQRQEYEHKTKRMYLHRAIWVNEVPLRREFEQTVKKHFR